MDGVIIAYSFPDGVVTEEAANLSKGHWPLTSRGPSNQEGNGCPIANHLILYNRFHFSTACLV